MKEATNVSFNRITLSEGCGEEKMRFNALIPELSVTDIEKSKWFYIELLGFKLEYEREDDKFIFVSLEEETQMMLEEINGHWDTGELKHPFGRGINFQIDIKDVQPVIDRLRKQNIPLFREPTVSKYKSNDTTFIQKEFLVQDPDGYLLRFSQEMAG
ncbi:bleomycin resistance protein [Bacillus pumilus]|uniref:bleomycin resistance protein n=3 Tax=Bacillus TaxID=1386 RepID=UPI003D9A8F8C|nr:catechol 2,3-dioxygenase-like lactoylglutathione lyase family enzyme [Bacillus pumilus]MDF9786474.1 catechol 2,3-dioxygenase-like lactoylglutathione lyase family enzyme [Bacillus pumilus]